MVKLFLVLLCVATVTGLYHDARTEITVRRRYGKPM